METRATLCARSGYRVALELNWGCPGSGRWLFELLQLAARGPARARLSPPNDRKAYRAWSPVPASPECGQTPLSALLSPILAVPTTTKKSKSVLCVVTHML